VEDRLNTAWSARSTCWPDDEVVAVLRDLREHEVGMLTLGRHLQPRTRNLPVRRCVTPAAFDALAELARPMGFKHAARGPLVRSSDHAARQFQAAGLSLPSTTNP
jgi:lipoic acid synthetase